MDTARLQKFLFILDRNLAKANCTGNHVCTSCDKVVLDCDPTFRSEHAFPRLQHGEPRWWSTHGFQSAAQHRVRAGPAGAAVPVPRPPSARLSPAPKGSLLQRLHRRLQQCKHSAQFEEVCGSLTL